MKRIFATLLVAVFAAAVLPAAAWANVGSAADAESASSGGQGSSETAAEDEAAARGAASLPEEEPLAPPQGGNAVSGAVELVVAPANPAASDNAPRGEGAIYQSVGAAVLAAQPGDSVFISAGAYLLAASLNVNKAITLRGAGPQATLLQSSAINGTAVVVGENAAVSDLGISFAYPPEALAAWAFNNNGVQLKSNAALTNCKIEKARNAVYVNNAQGAAIVNNTITNNRTGINLAGNCAGTQITGNTITDNWTVGVVMYQTATYTNFEGFSIQNNIFDNWYSEIVVKSALKTNSNDSAGTLDVTNNTFRDTRVSYSFSGTDAWDEPAFSAQRPVSLGGTAEKPQNEMPTLRIYNTPNAALAYTGAKTILLTPEESIATLAEKAAAGDSLFLTAGTYVLSERVTLNKSLSLLGAPGATVVPQVGNAEAFSIANTDGSILFDGINIQYPQGATAAEDTHKAAIAVYGTTVTGSLTVKNASITGAYQAIAVQTVGGNATSVGQLAVEAVAFENNLHKDIYVENAHQVSIKNCSFNNSAFGGGSVYPTRIACDINLKYHDDFTVVVADNTFSNIAGEPGSYNGVGGYGAALSLKARNDGSYAANPAAILSANITGNRFANNLCDLMLGEAGSGGALPLPLRTGNIQQLTIKNNLFSSLVQNNYSESCGLSANYWGSTLPEFGSIILGSYTMESYYAQASLGLLLPLSFADALPPGQVVVVMDTAAQMAENAKKLQEQDDQAVLGVLDLPEGKTAYLSKSLSELKLNANNQVALIVYEVAPYVRDAGSEEAGEAQATLPHKVTFRLPIPDNFSAPYVKLMHIHGNETRTYELDILGQPGERYIEVETDRFSQFIVSALAQKTQPSNGGDTAPALDATPNTGLTTKNKRPVARAAGCAAFARGGAQAGQAGAAKR